MNLLVAGLAAAAAAAPVQQPPISGTLNVRGYSVIALAADGHATVAAAPAGRFRLRPPAARVTLQLRAPDGSYAGPVVVGHGGGHVLLGVRAGATLGAIAFSPSLGYATAERVAPRWIDRARWGRARGGVEPFGARSLGRELSPPPRRPPPGDRDADGVPDVLDVDDDGDLVLDVVDPQAAVEPVRVTSLLTELGDPANVDTGMRAADIEAALVRDGALTISSAFAGRLDCSPLPWCSSDPMSLMHPRSTSDELRAGQIVFVRDATGRQVLGSVGSVFATVPALASYGDELGTHDLSYPLDPGAQLPVAGHSVRLRLWRPQRRAMPSDEVAADEGRWIDMGGLPMSARTADGTPCPGDAYSAVDPGLLPAGSAFVDTAPDVPSGQGATFGYTLDITRCMAAAGQSFDPGQQASLVFAAGGAAAGYTFVHQPPGP